MNLVPKFAVLPTPRGIHESPCALCPSTRGTDPESEQILAWPKEERLKTIFACAWRNKKYCKGYCDKMGVVEADIKKKKILVMGLPGSGKTVLSRLLAKKLNAVHFEADEIRREINKDLTFSIEDRIEQARRMGILCDIVARAGGYVIADFVCPTHACREAFDPDYIVWVDRIEKSRYPDTNQIFEKPLVFNFRSENPRMDAKIIANKLISP